jgi:hypothetical protein
MSEYRYRSTGQVKTQGQIRSDHPNTSLPKVWTEATCDSLGIDPVLASPQPATSADYKVVVRDGVEQDDNSNWVYAWTERDMFTEYEEEVTDEEGVTTTSVVTVQAQKDAYEANKLAKKREGMVVTMRQARLALSQAGKLTMVNEAIAVMDEPDKTAVSIEWEYGSTVERVSPWIDTMATALGMTDVEMDALFELAATL